MGSPCDTDVKWILRAGFNVDPSTLAKNLTILCTVAFSATVLYVVYSNSGKRPHYTDNNIQVCFSDEAEISEDDHTTQCETRCRHSVVGSSDGSKPPDSLMSFGILLEDIQSPSSRRACRLDSTVDVDSTNDRLGDSGTLVAPGSKATNDVGILDVMQDDKCSEDSNTGTRNLSSLTTSGVNSCDVSTATEVAVDLNMTTTESLCPQVEPSATSTASGPDAIESSCTQTLPSTTNTTSDGPNIMESSCTQTPPSTNDTASGPDETIDVNRATGNLNDTSLLAPSSSGRILGPLSNSKCKSAGVSTFDQPFDLSRESSGAHRVARFMRENAHFHYDPDCVRARVDLLRKCEESESQRRSRIDFNLRDIDSAGDLHSMEEEDDDGNHFVGYIYGIIREKGCKWYKRRLCEGVSIAKERMEQGQAECFREKLALGEKLGSRCQDTCTQIEGGKTCDEYGSTGGSQKIVEGIRNMYFDTVLRKDKRTSTSADISFDSSAREACPGKPLKQTNTLSSKEKTHHLKEKKSEKCRDKGTSTSVYTLPASSTEGPSTGRPLKHPRTIPKEETRHLIDVNLGEFERCAEERREEGIKSVHSQPIDPLEQTKRSLKALTETQHWSKMSLPEQYDYLGFLDSTLAAASAEWKRKWNVTYWRQKDSSPLPKPSGLSSLCKPQGSPKCPTPDMVHSCFQGDANGTNIPSSSGRQVEQCSILVNGHRRQHCAAIACVEAQQISLEQQGNRAQASHSQAKYQPSSPSPTCDTQPYATSVNA